MNSFEKNNKPKPEIVQDSALEKDQDSRDPSLEERREAFETAIEIALLHAVKRNEGHKGVICEIDIDVFPEEIIASFQEKNPSILKDKDSIASKMLKIYSAGASKNEAERQIRAYDIVKDNEGSEKDLAKVPTLLACEELTVTHDGLKEKLRDEGIDVSAGRIEIMLMDYIKGEDLAMYIVKKIVNHHPELRDLKQVLSDGEYVAFEELHRRMVSALRFSRPGGKHREEHLRMFEEIKIAGQNVDLMISYMERNDIVIEPKILEKLKNTIDLFQKKEFYHGDLHERNIMLELDDQGEMTEVYVIDYGDNRALGDGNLLEQSNDYQIVARYRSVTMNSVERKKKDNEKHLIDLEKLRSRAINKVEWKSIQENLASIKDASDIQSLIDRYIPKITIDSSLHWQLVELLLVDLAKDNRSLVEQYVVMIKNSQAPQFAKNNLSKLLNII